VAYQFQLEKTVTQVEAGLSGNPFASIKDGRLKLKRRDALPVVTFR
jgi:hypothetical protein